MGIFHKTLKDAKKYFEAGDFEEAKRILKDHYEKHASKTLNTILYRLQNNIDNYRRLLILLIDQLDDAKGFSSLRFQADMIDIEQNLNQIKKDIKKLLDTERIVLE